MPGADCAFLKCSLVSMSAVLDESYTYLRIESPPAINNFTLCVAYNSLFISLTKALTDGLNNVIKYLSIKSMKFT